MNNFEDYSLLITVKCAKLDIPPEFIPESQYLKKIFRQRLSLFESFISKVDSVNSVNCIRKNILIQLKLSENRAFSKNSNVIPKEYSDYAKYNTLLNHLQSLRETNNDVGQQEKRRLDIIKTNDQKCRQSKEILRVNRTKLNVLQAKTIGVNEEVEKELKLEVKIKNVTPRKFTSNDNIKEYAKSVNESIATLKKYSSESKNDIMKAKVYFWKSVSEKVINIPNRMLFRQLESQLNNALLSIPQTEHSIDLNASKVSNKLLPNIFQQKITSGIELMAHKKKLSSVKSECADLIRSLENNMESSLNSSFDYSFQLEDDDIIGDFVTELIAKLNIQGKIQFCSSVVDMLKQQQLGNKIKHERLVNDTKGLYDLIDDKFANIQEFVAQIYQINENKINFSKISLMRMIQSLKMEICQQHNRSLMSINQSSFNSTIIYLNKLNETCLPSHEGELQVFIDVPAQLNFISRGLSANKYRVLGHETVLPVNTTALENQFLYSNNFIEYMKKRLHSAPDINQLTKSVESDFIDLKIVNNDALEERHDNNCKEISTMLHAISKCNASLKSYLKNMNLLYDYGIKNPLKQFIPSNRKVLDKSYFEYEKDFMLYYNMIKN